MRTSNWLLSAALLGTSLTLNAAAQQAGDSPAPAAAATPTVSAQDAATQPAQSAPAPGQPATAAEKAAAQLAPPPPVAAPQTMDQVVNLFIEREHGLIKALSNRTPVVETYLQNLTNDPQLGPVPSEDHYFLGRMDMGETIDRKDYLKE
jgi:hypothetical protein